MLVEVDNECNAGYPRPPVNWEINNDRKRSFFQLVTEITGTTNQQAR